MMKWVMGAWLMALASHASALTLGNLQGSAIIGQPMDVLVRSTITAADTVSDLCLKAEVVYGETPVAANDVSVTIQRLGTQDTGALRVRVRPVVNEPIVLLNLQVGCRNPFRRQYTLLADFAAPPPVVEPAPMPLAPAKAPVAVPAVTPTRPAPVPPAGSSAAPAAPSAAAAAVIPPPAALSRPAPAPRPVQANPVVADDGVLPAYQPETPIRLSAPVPRPAHVVRLGSKYRPPAAVQDLPAAVASGAVQNAPLPRVERADSAGGSRLQLEPIDLSPLSVSPVLAQAANPAAADQSTTASAAASASPSADSTSDAVGGAVDPAAAADQASTVAAPALEQELAAMRQEQEKMRLALESLNTQLQQAQANRYTNPLVMGLAGLALLLLLALVWQLGRRPRQP